MRGCPPLKTLSNNCSSCEAKIETTAAARANNEVHCTRVAAVLRLRIAVALAVVGVGGQQFAGSAAGVPTERLPPFFRIDVVDQTTGRGVPAVRLSLANTTGLTLASDSGGIIAFHEPGLYGRDVFFQVDGDGYVVADKKARQQNGLWLHVKRGGRVTIPLQRLLAAERLYRVNGLDPYRDSRLLGVAPDHAEPLRAKILGQDSAFVTFYNGKLFWIWGDTTGLGPRKTWNFEASGATSTPSSHGGMHPDVGVDLHYFVNDAGFTRPMVGARSGGAMTWLDGLITLRDDDHRERMFALYVQMRRMAKADPAAPDAKANHWLGGFWSNDDEAQAVALARRRELGEAAAQDYLARVSRVAEWETRVTRGIMEFDPATQYFERAAAFPAHEIDELQVGSHAIRVSAAGHDYVYFSGLAPTRRVAAAPSAIIENRQYESFTCLTEGTRLEDAADGVERDADGRLSWAWKRNTAPVGPREQLKLVAADAIESTERWFVMRDVKTGKELNPHHHSIQWNPYRNRYVGLFVAQLAQSSSSVAAHNSFLAQVWYGEADTVMGPWAYFEKVVDVGDYSYYNPLHNPYFNQAGGRIIYFEGTYTDFLRRSQAMRPRYNYNQVMHKLDLDDPRVAMPAAVYSASDQRRLTTRTRLPKDLDQTPAVRFFAPDRPRPGCIAVYEVGDGDVWHLSTSAPPVSDGAPARVAFYAAALEGDSENEALTGLFACRNEAGLVRYIVEGEATPEGFQRDESPLCRVWSRTSRVNPLEFAPLADGPTAGASSTDAIAP